MSDIGGLPDHMQIMVVGAVVVISSVWGVIKFIKPFIDHLTPKPQTSQHSTDAVIISAALADTKPIKELTESIDKLCEVHEKGNILNQMLHDAIHRLIHKP